MKSLSNEFKSEIPSSILKLFDKKEVHKDIVNTGEIKETILGWLKKWVQISLRSKSHQTQIIS